MLPIVQRELAIASREFWTYWSRFAVAATFVGATLVAMTADSPATKTALLFRILSAVALALALVAGPLYSADCLSSEKRQGTLGLLFLTDLRSHDIVLGKLATSSLRASQAFLAIIPVMGLPILLGGVALHEFSRVLVTVGLTLALSLALGLFWSAATQNFRTVNIASAASILLLVFCGSALSRARAPGSPRSSEFFSWIAALSPISTFATAFDDLRRSFPGLHDQGLRVQTLLVLALVGSSFALIHTNWRETPVPTGRRPRGSFTAGYRHVLWRPLLDRSPYAWLIRAVRPGTGVLWLTLLPLGIAFLTCLGASLTATTASWIWLDAAACIAYLAHTATKFLLALAVTRNLSEDRHSGGLELLMVSGLDSDQIVDGIRRGLGRQFSGAFQTLLVMNLLLIARCSLRSTIAPGELLFLTSVSIWGIVALFVDGWILSLVGARWALRESSPQRAFRTVVFRYLLPGTAIIAGLPACAWLLDGMGAPPFGPTFFAVGIFTCLALVQNTRASVDLEKGFRQLAAGLPFDTGEWVLRRTFQRSAMTEVRS